MILLEIKELHIFKNMKICSIRIKAKIKPYVELFHWLN